MGLRSKSAHLYRRSDPLHYLGRASTDLLLKSRALISRIAITRPGHSADVATAKKVDIDRASAEVLKAWEFYLKSVLPPETVKTASSEDLIEKFLYAMREVLPERFPGLGGASMHHIDLIIFRGVLFSLRHPQEQMIAAIRRISARLSY
jgi:hypothetical protein